MPTSELFSRKTNLSVHYFAIFYIIGPSTRLLEFHRAFPLISNSDSKVIEGPVSCNICVIPLFHTGPESHELTRMDKYLDSWLSRTQFVMVLTDSHSP